MLVSWKWLKELVEIKETPEEIAELLTRSGIEVEGIIKNKIGQTNLVVGYVREIVKHPQADKLLICRVVVGEEEKTIVTGADNVKEGHQVVVALPGALLANGMLIKEASLRGVNSEGMLCSAAELGLEVVKLPEEARQGLYILPEMVEIGADVVELLELDDQVLELELTPDRADCLGMINLAREIAALTGGELKLPYVKRSIPGGEAAKLINVEIENPDLCFRYVARLIKDVQIGPSPLWLQHRLLSVGIRPINNVVDVTNYVMLERGQPLHAFDYEFLTGKKIIVRQARENEKLVTLDGQTRKLDPEMLVIADTQKPVALAGVMGGLESEVTSQTKMVLLESACFSGTSVRRTSRKLGLLSEAALRFEKGVDVQQAHLAADRALELLEEIGAGVLVEGCVDNFPVEKKRAVIKLRYEKVNQVLGTALSIQEMEKHLKALRIKVVEKNDESGFYLPPSERLDLNEEIDLIEEIARLYGYEQIPHTLPEGVTTQGFRTKEQNFRRKIRRIMVAQGLYEVINYSFINSRHLDALGIPEKHVYRDVVKIQNPLSEEQAIMRTTLLPGLLENIRKNIYQQHKNLKLFELGKVYWAAGFPQKRNLPLEKWLLSAVCTGEREKSWSWEAQTYDFYYLKGVLENLLTGLGCQDWVWEKAVEVTGFHPGRTVYLKLGGETLGVLGELHPFLLEKYEIEQRVCLFNLDVKNLFVQTSEVKNELRPLSKYPPVTRDLALVVPESVPAGEIYEVIKKEGGEWLLEVKLFDLYRGQQIASGQKSLAFSLTWQAPHKTFTDAEINILSARIATTLKAKFEAQLRH